MSTRARRRTSVAGLAALAVTAFAAVAIIVADVHPAGESASLLNAAAVHPTSTIPTTAGGDPTAGGSSSHLWSVVRQGDGHLTVVHGNALTGCD